MSLLTEVNMLVLLLPFLNVHVGYHSITAGFVTVILDWEAALNKSGGDWPLSVDQPSIDYLQVIFN